MCVKTAKAKKRKEEKKVEIIPCESIGRVEIKSQLRRSRGRSDVEEGIAGGGFSLTIRLLLGASIFRLSSSIESLFRLS